MADRYWGGGTGTWDATNTFNWSASSGGAGGASVPTAADNVFFDANSNIGTAPFTVTMANTPRVCNDFTASGLDGAMTLAGSAIGLTVSGSLDWPATNFTRTYTGTTTFNATTTGKTVTARVAFGAVTFDGVGGGWTLGFALDTGSSILTITNGTFDTSSSGNYAVTTFSFSSSNSNARTINLNASTITASSTSASWSMATSTNATVNAGTSTINCSGSSANFSGGGLTYYNLAVTNAGFSTATISGTNTFTNLTIPGRTTLANTGIVNFGASQIISGTLALNVPTAAAYRTMLASSVIGTPVTLTCAAITGGTDYDFRDIVIAGAASPISPTRAGDCKGNSGITFPAAKTVYYGQTGSNNWGSGGNGSWSATSGGALDATMFPLAQDTAVFPAATYPASGSTTTFTANYNVGTIDMSLRTSNTMTFATSSNAPTVYGNWINGTGISFTGNGLITFAGRTAQTITSAAKTFTQPITINSPSGSVTLQANLTLTVGSTLTTTLTQGTLDLNNFTLSTPNFNSNNSNTRTIAFGTGQISLTSSGSPWNTTTTTGMTTTGTQVVNIIYAGASGVTVSTGALSEANSISFNFTGGTYALTFLTGGSNTAKNVDFTGYAGTLAANATTAIIYGDLKLSTGMTLTATPSQLNFGATSGIKQITTNGKTIDQPITFNGVGGTWQLQDALTSGSTRSITLTNGTLDLFGKTVTVGSAFGTGVGTKNLTFNGGTLICPAAATNAFINNNPTGFTTTAGTGTGTISMTAATAKTFVGGGSTFNCTLNQGGAGALTITGSNTFNDITNTTQPASILFTAATTSTFTNFSLSGTAGNLITIGSATAASHTLSKASGTVSANYLSISQSTATGGATWEAFTTNGNVDGGNNTGWNFGGVIYAAVIAETATATDAILGLAAFYSALSETATATDAPSVAASTFNAPVAETATATDSPSVAASTFNAPVSETATATDSILGRAAFNSALSETATATDSPSVAASTFNAPVSETATATDTVISFADFYATLSETATATDSVLSFADFYAALAEAATATDSVLGFSDLFVSLEETATATDSPLVAPSTFNAPVAETATATDAVSPPGSIYNAPVSETVTISDSVLGAYLWNLIDDSQSVTWQNVNSSPGTVWSPIDTDPDTGWSVIPTVN